MCRWNTDTLSYGLTGQGHVRFALSNSDADAGSLGGIMTRLGDFDRQVTSAPGHDPRTVILFGPDTRVLISTDAL